MGYNTRCWDWGSLLKPLNGSWRLKIFTAFSSSRILLSAALCLQRHPSPPSTQIVGPKGLLRAPLSQIVGLWGARGRSPSERFRYAGARFSRVGLVQVGYSAALVLDVLRHFGIALLPPYIYIYVHEASCMSPNQRYR